jgi:ATP-dependent helicase Lhr and Lhr-like helicase
MPPPSDTFRLLDPSVQRWIYEQGWTELRDIQEKAVAPILEGSLDVILASATASGKTEAAFLPICSRMLAQENSGACVLYISPLKALINDQSDRMERLCETLSIQVHPWHGDVSQGRKREFLRKPKGILLITPESLEAIFVNRGSSVGALFSTLLYVIVDELHSFIGTERGQQLQSLLGRVEYAIGRRVPRIALSATLGDMRIAAEFLRPQDGDKVQTLVSAASGQELKLLVRGYRVVAPGDNGVEEGASDGDDEAREEPESDGSVRAVAADLLKTLRGSKNLVFANSRGYVEKYTDLLRRLCEAEHLPNEFWPHHGNLSKEIRQDAESALKDNARPATAICTSTLELGIDIGRVSSIAQIGTPISVASLRQRLGRSGRRGEPAVLRIYIRESEIDSRSSIEDLLRVEMVQTVAMVNLLLTRWCEPSRAGSLHLSTLVQQLLSIIAQFGGVTPKRAWTILRRAFAADQSVIAQVLGSLGAHRVIRQESDGTLLLDEVGEQIVNHYSFYAAFATTEEYRIVAAGKTLGTLPIDRPLEAGNDLIFAGRRWRVVAVDQQRKTIDVVPAPGGRVPVFTSERGGVHDRIRQEMQAVYVESAMPSYLDATARGLLREGRRNFVELGLEHRGIVPSSGETLLFTWRGDRANDTLALWLRYLGVIAQNAGPSVRAFASEQEVLGALRRIASDPVPAPEMLAGRVQNKSSEKYDALLDEELMNAEYASRKLDLAETHELVESLLIGWHGSGTGTAQPPIA